jgi:hypothetical protein
MHQVTLNRQWGLHNAGETIGLADWEAQALIARGIAISAEPTPAEVSGEPPAPANSGVRIARYSRDDDLGPEAA